MPLDSIMHIDSSAPGDQPVSCTQGTAPSTMTPIALAILLTISAELAPSDEIAAAPAVPDDTARDAPVADVLVNDVAPPADAPALVEERPTASWSFDDALALRGFAVVVELIDGTIVAGELRGVDENALHVENAYGELIDVPVARVRSLGKRDSAPPPSHYAYSLPAPDGERPSMTTAAGFAGAGACIGCGVAVGAGFGAVMVLAALDQPEPFLPIVATTALAVPAAGAVGGALVSTHDDPHGFVVAAGGGVGAVAGIVVGSGVAFAVAQSTGPLFACGFAGICVPNVIAIGGIAVGAVSGRRGWL